jgi:hypothetical protein
VSDKTDKNRACKGTHESVRELARADFFRVLRVNKMPESMGQKLQKKRGAKVNSLSERYKKEWSFFINAKTGKIRHNKKCLRCTGDCKQSYRVKIIACKHFENKGSHKA